LENRVSGNNAIFAKIKQNLNDAKIDINYIIKTDVTMNNHAIRITLNLPAELLAATDRAVSEGKAKSHNELATKKRAEIDAEFAHMAKDTEYQAEVEIINQEFAHSDWEALQLGES
jgi:hypothetical protein